MQATVGQLLKGAREALGIRIEDAAQATHIKLVYLQELENDHPELLPSPTNARGFLRLYASFLRISPQTLIDLWDHPALPQPVTASLENKVQAEVVQTREEVKPAPDQTSLPVDQAKVDEGLEKKQGDALPPATMPKPQLALTGKKSKKNKRMRKEMVKLAVEESFPAGNELIQSPESAQAAPAENEIKEPNQSSQQAVVSGIPQIAQKSSAELFVEIGKALRQRREILQLSLADIERFTHIKRPFLEALEGGAFSQLPSSVQGRGMLNNYVAFLNMDEESVMSLYASALEAQRQERLPPRKPEPIVTGGIRFNIPAPFKKYLNLDMLFGSVIILAMAIFLLWGAVQVFTQQYLTPTPAAPSISKVLQITPSMLVTPDLTLTVKGTMNPQGTPVPGIPAVPAVVTQLATKNSAPLQLYIVALQRAYLKVTVDSKVVFDGRVQPGSVYTYSGQKSIELLTGSAAALEVYFNQEFLGKLGEVGKVIKLTFNDKGLTTPIPTVTPLATITATPTKTPLVTPTTK